LQVSFALYNALYVSSLGPSVLAAACRAPAPLRPLLYANRGLVSLTARVPFSLAALWVPFAAVAKAAADYALPECHPPGAERYPALYPSLGALLFITAALPAYYVMERREREAFRREREEKMGLGGAGVPEAGSAEGKKLS
jgi:hypothetical protein